MITIHKKTKGWKDLTRAILLFAIFPLAWGARPLILKSDINICFFRNLTGRPCPFCGLTHAFAHAMHGEFSLASGCHYFWWMAVLVIVALGLIFVFDFVNGTNISDHFAKLRGRPAWLIVCILVVLTFLRFFLGKV